ncbi:MAG: hypothetical protein WC100_03395 [Sterolibacterium sp.]
MSTVLYKPGVADTDSNPSPNLWGDCPLFTADRELSGYGFFDDFCQGPQVVAGAEAAYGNYRGFASTGGSAVPSTTAAGGVLVLSSDGDNEGASIRAGCPGFLITRDAKKFWMEARIKTSTIADTKHGFLLGLLEDAALTAILPIAADGTLADNNLVGFHRLEGDGDYVNQVYRANGVTQVTTKEDANVLVADTWIKLGLVFNPANDYQGNASYLQWFVNGLPLTDKKLIPNATGTDFPADVTLAPVFAVLNATGSTPGNSSIDWWGAYQLR